MLSHLKLSNPTKQFVNKNLNLILLLHTQPLPQIEAKIRCFSFLASHCTVQLARLDDVRNDENSQIRWQQDDITAWHNTVTAELIALGTSPTSNTNTFQRQHRASETVSFNMPGRHLLIWVWYKLLLSRHCIRTYANVTHLPKDMHLESGLTALLHHFVKSLYHELHCAIKCLQCRVAQVT